nr:NUDIX domain-containing protein [Corynebacterium freiburgense]
MVLRNAAGDVLSVRKQGTHAFMLPGGKVETGEDPRHTACREIQEELGLLIDPDTLEYFGEFTAPAANEPGWNVRCDVFILPKPLDILPRARAEIVESVWCSLTEETRQLAPLSRDIVFPALCN